MNGRGGGPCMSAGGPGRDLVNAKIVALMGSLAAGGCPAPNAAAAGREALKARVSFVAKWVSCACVGGAVVAAVAAAVAAPCLRRLRRRLRRARSRTRSRDSLLRRTRSWEGGGGEGGPEAALLVDREDGYVDWNGDGDGHGDEDEDQTAPLLRNMADEDADADDAAMGAGAGVGFDFGVGVVVIPKSPGDSPRDSLRRDDDDRDPRSSDSELDDSDSEDGGEDDVSLACSTRVPQWVKWALPLALVGNIVLFVSSNTAVGASVMLSAQLRDARTGTGTGTEDGGGTPAGSGGAASGAATGGFSYPDVPLMLPPLFDFTLANSVKDMWRAKVYPLSVLIAVFSGGWPYLKLALMLAAWVAPPRAMPVPRRGRLLGALDALGKWSLIDAFVMTLFMVAFRFHIETPPTPVVDPWSSEASEASAGGSAVGGSEASAMAMASLDVTVEPKWGFYSFLLATVLSLVLGHVTLGWHRAALESAAAKQGAEGGGGGGLGGGGGGLGGGGGGVEAMGMGVAGRSQRRVALWRRLKGGKGYRVFAGASVASCLAASAALVVSGGADNSHTTTFTRLNSSSVVSYRSTTGEKHVRHARVYLS